MADFEKCTDFEKRADLGIGLVEIRRDVGYAERADRQPGLVQVRLGLVQVYRFHRYFPSFRLGQLCDACI